MVLASASPARLKLRRLAIDPILLAVDFRLATAEASEDCGYRLTPSMGSRA
jgi:hypothetical protein